MKKKLLKSILFSFLTVASVFTLAACGKSKKTTKKNFDETTPELEGYKILWSDEFNGDTLDETLWERNAQPARFVNNEWQKYVKDKENAYVKDGNLVIKAIEGEFMGEYTSAKLTSKKSVKYGKICVRAKVPAGQGLWPAIWMLSENGEYGDWPMSGEIDIMEILGHETEKTYGTIHYGNPHLEQQGTYILQNDSFSDSYHEFSCEWEPGKITFFIDGVAFKTINDWYTSRDKENFSDFPAPFDKEFILILNLAVGGDWPGDPDPDLDLENLEFDIDYVRVYQKESYDEASVRRAIPSKAKHYKEADATGNFISDGTFEALGADSSDNKSHFASFTQEGGAASFTVSDNVLTVDITKVGTVDYSVQLFQAGLPCKKGVRYKISFDAYADEETKMIVKLNEGGGDWQTYSDGENVRLTTTKQTFELPFTMTFDSVDAARLDFNMGKEKATKIYISNVRYEEVKD